MTPLGPHQYDPRQEWPGAPKERKGTSRHARLKMVAERGRAYFRTLTLGNLHKAVRHARQGNFTLIWLAFRTLAMSRLATRPAVLIEPENTLSSVALAPGQPLVSIIIPCFNYGRFIEAAVDSVLAQTLKDVEILVIDGGSTDGNTRPLLSQLERPKTRVYLRSGRHLVGSNRNFGIERALGRYICCLDADDTLEPTYLEKAIFHLETYGYDCISTAIRLTGAREGTVGVLEFPDLTTMMQGNHMHTCAVFRRVLWTLSGGYYDTGLGAEHVAEDWDFWLRLAAEGARLRNISGEALFNYQVHERGSLSSTNVRSIEEQRQAILQRNRRLLGPELKQLSARQAERSLRCPVPGGALQAAMQHSVGERSPCLLIALPFLLIGGAERLLSTLTGSLVKAGWRVILITSLPQDPLHGDSVGWFGAHTSEIYRLPAFLQPEEWNDFVDYLIDSRQPDCLLLAGSHYIYERLPNLRKRQPFMAVVDLLFNTVGHVNWHKRFREYFTGALAENQEVAEWFHSIGWPPERVRRVASGVDTDAHIPRRRDEALRVSLGVGPDDFIVGFSGRMAEEKAPEVFLNVARLCSGDQRIRFLMTGAGPLSEAIEQEAIKVPGNTVNYLGRVEDVAAVIAQYDVLVLPSRLDGRPLVVLEALSMGVPVIASAIGGLPELIEEGVNGFLCPPADGKAIATRLLELAADRPRLENMKKAARLRAVANLGVAAMADGYRTALLEAMRIHREEVATELNTPPSSTATH